MQKVSTFWALFHCAIIGGVYGAALGAAYIALLSIREALTSYAPWFPWNMPLIVMFGAVFGSLAGAVSAVLGGCLGGPVGCSFGGFIGTCTMMTLFGWWGSAAELIVYPSIVAAAFGFVAGHHIRRRVPLFPGVEWLADSIYSSPLGGWLGWRQRRVR